MQEKPVNVVITLIDAINRGDLEAALKCYEAQASIVAQPGQIARGKDEVRAALAGIISLKPTIKEISHQLVEAGDIALFCSKWKLTGTAPDGNHTEMSGASSDVLRRQPEGRWLIAVDNPWGTEIVT
jgi:uncharacterized protein (TIGR02246 family)